jgi:hypothetical protein
MSGFGTTGHPPGTVLKPLVKLGRTPDDCYEWLGALNTNGVAQKRLGDRTYTARRWMWQQLFGPIPDGLVVTTTCGSLTCCNPHHLRCCFQADANRAGPGVTLLPGDVAKIRAAAKTRNSHTASQLAARYGVTPNTIRDVWNRKSWRRAKLNHGPHRRKEQDDAA